MEAEWVKSETSDAENLAMAAGYHAPITRASREVQNILLVEDETLVREVIFEVLQAAGFTVRTSRNAEDALDVLKSWDGTLQLLLTDVILPGSSGKELARQLRSRYPKMKTIFMSGYARTAALPGADREANVSFLSKPFSVAALMRKVEDSLQEELETTVPDECRLQKSVVER